MIKAMVTTDDQRKIILFGLSAGNLRQLQLGRPIHILSEEIELPFKAEFVIFFGQTEEDMAADLKQLIGPKTIVKDERDRLDG